MSVFALNTCQEANGVSWLHGEVSKKMFAGIWKGYSWEESHVGYVTNGVHMPTWAASEWKSFYAERLGEQVFANQSDPKAWEGIFNVSDEDIWNLRMLMKNKFINFVKRDFKAKWLANQGDPSAVMSIVDKINPDALIIGFARRFATYKRAHLLFTDLDRLAKIVNNERFPVQFVFSGKAHPADGAGQGLIKRILEISRMPQFLGKIIFLEDYNMIVAKRLVTGVDIWLNTPPRPLEAATIYSMLENEIVPLYFEKNSKGYSPKWIQYIKGSIGHIAPHFTMTRMINDYIDRFYNPEKKRSTALKADDFKLAKEIVAWKESVVEKWNGINVVSLDIKEANPNLTGEKLDVTAVIDTNGIGKDLGLEYVSYRVEDGVEHLYETKQFKVTKTDGNVLTYHLDEKVRDTGVFRYGFRLYPINPNLAHRQDFAFVRWI